MATGIVRKWDTERGYGFIHDDDGKDYFVHHSAIEGSGRSGSSSVVAVVCSGNSA